MPKKESKSAKPESEQDDAPRQWLREDFKTPPVKGRRFLVRLDIDRQSFEQKANSLVDAIQQEGHFDVRGMKAQWDFRLEFQDKTPKPKVLLTHIPMVTRSAKGNIPRTVLELYPPIESTPAQFIIDQERTDEQESSFEDIEQEIHKWLPIVMGHFGVSEVGGFVLEYRNLIERNRYPMFWKGKTTLKLDRLLQLFKTNNVPAKFVTPFSVEFNMDSPLSEPGNVRFRMETKHHDGQELDLQVTLAYNSLMRKKKREFESVSQELTDAHDVLFENFVRQFAPEALEAFTQ